MDQACSVLGVGIYRPDGRGAVKLYGQGSVGRPEDLQRRVLVVGPNGLFRRPVWRPSPLRDDEFDGKS